jgi:hypothetical protein
MFRAMIESILGEWGRALLYFYDEYSLWINLVVVIYGMWIVLSWVNLKAIRKSLILSVAAQLKTRPDSTGALSKKELNALIIPWESAIQQARFPFIAQQNGFLPHRISVTKVQSLLPTADLAAEALAMVNLQGKK